MQVVVIIDHQQFVDAGMVGEKAVGHLDWIRVEIFLINGMNLVTGDGGLGDAAVGVAWLYYTAG